MNADPPDIGASCPLPHAGSAEVTLAHGGGGRLMQRLIEDVFVDAFGREASHDGAIIEACPNRTVVTTDAFVVNPRRFPGGDIGALAVHGTVNDLAMCGARPLALTAAFILEEGLAIDELRQAVRSMADAAREADVGIVTGDTKVVERGHGDGLYITTTGIGALDHDLVIHPRSIRAGDALIVNGDLGRHGTAVMCAREGLATDPVIVSDQQSLWPAVDALIEAGIALHCLRDPTRGGLATTACELAATARLSLELDEATLAVSPEVESACDLFGLDPLYVANEGRFLAVVGSADADRAVEVLRGIRGSEAATRCGVVASDTDGRVTLRTRLGTFRHVAMLSGSQLPRIC